MVNYSEEAMLNALSAVADGMTLRKASLTFGVPKSTLLYKHNGKYPVKSKMGPQPILSLAVEKLLCDWIIHMGRCRFLITKSQLLDSVQRLLNDQNRETVFKDNRPGRAWFNRFLKRNPEISVYQHLTRARSSVTEFQIRHWFDKVNEYIKEKQYSDILNDPTRIFNLDETAFLLTPVGAKVLAKKENKSVYSFVYNDDKECLTSLIGSNADGTFIPPMVTFPYLRIPERITTSVPTGWGIGRSESGWMTGETFFEYIANIFHPWLTENKIKLPVIVFIDGHTSHLTYALSEFCSQNGIILLALFPNATHIIQPMDVGYVWKDHWRDRIHQFQMDHIGKKIKRKDFCGLLNDILETMKTKTDILRSAFRTCGLYPFDADSINYAETIKNQDIDPLSFDGILLKSEKTNTEQSKEEVDGLLHLVFFEEYIGVDRLKKFKSAGDAWNGALEEKGLFDIWNQMRKDLENISNDIYTVSAVCNARNETFFSDELSEVKIEAEELPDDNDEIAVRNANNETVVSKELSESVKIEVEELPEDDKIAYNSDNLDDPNCFDDESSDRHGYLLHNIDTTLSKNTPEFVINQVESNNVSWLDDEKKIEESKNLKAEKLIKIAEAKKAEKKIELAEARKQERKLEEENDEMKKSKKRKITIICV